MKNLILVSVVLVLMAAACASDPALPTSTPEPTATDIPMELDPFEINMKLGRGVNLGNALEGPTEGAWGVVLQEEYFDLIAERGFDSVRIPIRWSAHALPDEPFTITPSFLERVDWAVENALTRDLAVIINFHHYDEIFLDPAGHEERFLAMWEQLAGHYKDAPGELVFEILNEPHDALTPALWNDLLVKALAVIRESNPTRIVMIGTGEWGGISGLKSLELPEDEPNLIVTVHYYLPFAFTHQGAEWADDSDAWLGMTWDGTPGQQKLLRGDLNTAAQWAKEHNRPIYLGEFGAYEKADMESRARWTETVVRAAEEFGFSWGYWEFCAGFGIYDQDTESWREPLVHALLPEE